MIVHIYIYIYNTYIHIHSVRPLFTLLFPCIPSIWLWYNIITIRYYIPNLLCKTGWRETARLYLYIHTIYVYIYNGVSAHKYPSFINENHFRWRYLPPRPSIRSNLIITPCVLYILYVLICIYFAVFSFRANINLYSAPPPLGLHTAAAFPSSRFEYYNL